MMKTLVICISVHHGNTRKIAQAMAEVLDADVLEPANIDVTTLDKYDLVGFGSGIYGWKHHNSLLNLVDKLPHTNKKAFIFSTRGNLVRVVPLEIIIESLEIGYLKRVLKLWVNSPVWVLIQVGR